MEKKGWLDLERPNVYAALCLYITPLCTQKAKTKTTKTIVKLSFSISFNGKTMAQPKTGEDDDMVVWT